MMSPLVALVAAIALIAPVHADDVLVLTKDNFDQALADNENILVEFYAPWCGHCKRLEPEYAEAATALKGKFTLAKVDATEESDLGTRFGVRGYPTLKLFRNGVESEYKGGRTKDTIVSYLEKQLLPAVTPLADADAAKAFVESDKVVVVGSFAAAEGDAYAEFTKTASALRDDFLFGEIVGNADVAAAVSVAEGEVKLFQNFAGEDKQVLAADEISLGALSIFIKSNSVPLVDEVGPENYRVYAEMGLPLAFVFADPSDEAAKDAVIKAVVPVARELKGKMNFVWADGVKYVAQAKNLGLTGDKMPCVAVQRMADDAHFGFDESAEITTDAVSAWANSILSGELQPTIKSEPIPENNDGPVTIVVGDSWTDIVLDETKDVLVSLVAPWCGHCKKLAPVWDELGEHFAGVDDLVIAKMDATANDATGVSVRGFPTIKFFPKGSKSNPLDYNGGREVSDFIAYLEKEATVDLNNKTAKKDTHDEL